MNEQVFKIKGFHCDSCVKLVTMKVKKINDVRDVKVLPDGETTISADRVITLDEVTKALDGLGYTVVS